MKSVLLIGLGRFGQRLAGKLNELHHQVMAVDKQEERVNDVLPLVTDAQIGDAANLDFLRSLGVDNYDVCFVAIGADFESSLVITAYLKELGAKKVVSRAATEVHRQFLLRNGADEVVFPAKQLADWTAMRYTTDHVLDYISLGDDYGIYDLSVPAEWDGKTVANMDIRRKYNLNLLAIREDGKGSVVITGDTQLWENQTVLVLGKWKDVQKCFRM